MALSARVAHSAQCEGSGQCGARDSHGAGAEDGNERAWNEGAANIYPGGQPMLLR